MRTIGLVLYDGIRAFDYAVVAEVWGVDRRAHGVPRVELRRYAAGGRPVWMVPGAEVRPTHALPDGALTGGSADDLTTVDLVVVLGRAEPEHPVPAPVLHALRAAHAAGVEIAALCSGAFVLGAAGLLDGRRATTHWLLTGQLAAGYPLAKVEPGVLFVEDRGVWTSAGTAAGIDLCLHLVRRAHGAEVANTVARRMVTATTRDGGQAQFIDRPVDPDPVAVPASVAATMEWALHRLQEPLSVADLARHADTAPRTFARHFTASTGTTPARWLTRQRVTEAQRLLETTTLGVEQVATRCGFASATVLRRHFTRLTGTAPTSYRRALARPDDLVEAGTPAPR